MQADLISSMVRAPVQKQLDHATWKVYIVRASWFLCQTRLDGLSDEESENDSSRTERAPDWFPWNPS